MNRKIEYYCKLSKATW